MAMSIFTGQVGNIYFHFELDEKKSKAEKKTHWTVEFFDTKSGTILSKGPLVAPESVIAAGAGRIRQFVWDQAQDLVDEFG